MDDREIERLFAGQAPDGDAELGEIARFFEDLGEAVPEASTQGLEAAHVAAMAETAHLLAESGEPVARPASKAHGPESQVSGLSKLRRTIMVRNVLRSPKARVAVVTLVLVMVFGGTALAASRDALPAPIQHAASTAGGAVGIDLPDPDDANVDDGDVNNVDEGDVNNVDNGDQNNTDNADQGNVDNADQGNVQQGDQNNADNADQNNADNGTQNNADDGTQNNADNGPQNNTDNGGQNNTDNGGQNNGQN